MGNQLSIAFKDIPGRNDAKIVEFVGDLDATNVENRTHNLFNEITSISSGGTTSVSSVAHDAAGNMISLQGRACPSGTADLNLTWDPWNRLVRLSDTSDIVIATYTYDGEPPSRRRLRRAMLETLEESCWRFANRVLL